MKKALIVLALVASTSANAHWLDEDYDKYESDGIVESVLAKEYYGTREDRKNTRKVMRTDKKIARTTVKWGDSKPKKIRRCERKIARTINKMDVVALNAEAIPSIEEDVPEPSPLLLLGAGLVGLGVSRKFLVK